LSMTNIQSGSSTLMRCADKMSVLVEKFQVGRAECMYIWAKSSLWVIPHSHFPSAAHTAAFKVINGEESKTCLTWGRLYVRAPLLDVVV
jgi:hypothetical protein